MKNEPFRDFLRFLNMIKTVFYSFIKDLASILITLISFQANF